MHFPCCSDPASGIFSVVRQSRFWKDEVTASKWALLFSGQSLEEEEEKEERGDENTRTSHPPQDKI